MRRGAACVLLVTAERLCQALRSGSGWGRPRVVLGRITDWKRTAGRRRCLRKLSVCQYGGRIGDLGTSEQVTRRTCGTVGVVVRMMKRDAQRFDVCARIRPLPALEKGGKGQKYLCDGEEENRRPPERARE